MTTSGSTKLRAFRGIADGQHGRTAGGVNDRHERPKTTLAAAPSPADLGLPDLCPRRREGGAGFGRAGASFLDFRRTQAHSTAMRKRVRIALAVWLVAIAGVVAWQALRPLEREPVYQGKRLRTWLSEYLWASARRDGRTQDLAAGAVLQIGTNAVPILLNMLCKEDSALVSKLVDFWDFHIGRRYVLSWVTNPAWYRNRAQIQNREAVARRRGFAPGPGGLPD